MSQVRSRQDPDVAFPSGRGTKLACVLVKADKMDVVVLGGLQFAGEPCAGIAAEHRAPGAESLNGEQIPRPAQALDVAESMTRSHFASPREPSWASRSCRSARSG